MAFGPDFSPCGSTRALGGRICGALFVPKSGGSTWAGDATNLALPFDLSFFAIHFQFQLISDDALLL